VNAVNSVVSLLAVFAATSLGIIGLAMLVFDVFLRDRARIEARLKAEFRDRARDRAKQSPLFRDLRQLAADSKLQPRALAKGLQTAIEQAGLMWSLTHFALLAGLLGALAGGLTWLLAGQWLAALAAACAGATVPLAYVHWIRKRRMALLCRQLPDAFDVMARALRAGQSVPAAFQAVANDFPLPIAEEFAHCYEQQHLGVPCQVALRDLARRTGIVETQIFVVALIVNQQVGGNLAELLGKLAETLRKRARFHKRVRALTGEGRMQAAVLIALPILAFFAVLLIDRSYAQALLDRPRLLLWTALSQVIGALCIRKIINIRY
jgi:tight adherence protein B